MALTVVIGGVTMDGDSHFIDEGSPNHVNALGQRDTFSCRVVSKDGSYKPAIGASVEVTDDAGLRFGGSIRELTVSQFGVALLSEVQCASWEQIFDRRYFGETKAFTDTPAGDVFQYIFDNWLTFENLTASVVASGPNITITLDWCTVREAFDAIAALASGDTDTYLWDCTAAKVTRFYKQSSFSAPINCTDSEATVLRPITVNQSFGGSGVGYANKAWVRVGRFVTDERTNTYSPDGSLTSFAFELPLAKVPTVTLSGVVQTIGIRDVDTGKDCYWQDGSPDITFDAAPASGTDTLVVVAQGYQTTIIDAGQIDDEVAARSIAEDNSGWYQVLIELSDAGTSAEAIAKGQAELVKRGGIPQAVEYVTTTNGIKAGMHQTVSLSAFGLSATYVIESVTMFQAGPNYGWRVRAVAGALAAGWMQKLRAIATGTTVSTSGGGTVVEAGSTTVAPDNVTITSVTPDVVTVATTRGAKRITPPRGVEIRYAPPATIGTFKGVLVELEAPDQSAVDPLPLDGSAPLDGTTGLGGPKEPVILGPFAHSDTDGILRIQVDEPTNYPETCRVRLRSYSDTVTNDSATAPSMTFDLTLTTTRKPGSGTAHAPNPTAVAIEGTAPDGSDNPRIDNHGVSETHLWVHVTAPTSRVYGGYQLILKDADGNTINATGVQTEEYFELVFATPATVQDCIVYACGSDGVNINPLVEGITPSATVTLGTASGTVNLGHAVADSVGTALAVVDGVLGVPDSSITEALIDTFAVSAAKIAAGAVETAKIANAAVDATKIANLAVGTAHIQAAAITNAKIGNLAVDTAQIANTAITTAKIANLAVTNALIADLAATKITAGTLTAGVIYAGTINCSQIGTGTLPVGVIYAGSVAASQITAGTISASISLTSPTLVITSGARTINIDTSNYILLTDTGISSKVYFTPGACIAQSTSNASIFAQISHDGTSGYMEVSDSSGNVSSLRAGTASSASAGAATLPSNPVGFFKVRVNGTIRNVPYYS